MSLQELSPTVVMFFHDLFTVVWVGGLITLGVVVVPSARKAFGQGPEMQQLMSTIQARLRWFVYASIVGLVLTGILLSRSSVEFAGFFSWGDTYSPDCAPHSGLGAHGAGPSAPWRRRDGLVILTSATVPWPAGRESRVRRRSGRGGRRRDAAGSAEPSDAPQT